MHLCPVFKHSHTFWRICSDCVWDLCPGSMCCLCEQVYCITTSTITITIIYRHHKRSPSPSTHFRSCSRIAGRSERSASARDEPIPGHNRGDIPTPSAVRPSVLYQRREASEITVCSLCVCMCRCVLLCKRQRWVAEADWPARHEGQSRRNTPKTTSAYSFTIKALMRQIQILFDKLK